MGQESNGFARTIAELREFASFSHIEQEFIERSLDIAMARGDAIKTWSRTAEDRRTIRLQYLAYRELRQLRRMVLEEAATDNLEQFMGPLLRISAQDLALEQLDSFSAYRFLYERLLGAGVRPWLPAAFCGAAALPSIRPCRRRVLLQSLSEAAATAPGWSTREPGFFPERVEVEVV